MPTWTTHRPASVTPPAPAGAVRVRTHAVLWAVLFVPALVAAKIAVLATHTGSRCLTYGGCTPFPSVAFLTLCGLAAAAMVVALAGPAPIRGGALAAQLMLEAVAVTLVLAYP
ncbi:hypothetical protein [Streptomyces sp. RerS4]|uniref:hypothetical protein n=1 Tax=Streptomyces sp. RerS4 TaxID=2942449 RepID=UPI00201BBDF0|nr:hypothetical protein [Streptomyces sp. RerS4]UQX01703.1 hypothetical protein M4D82_15180 [Streptomyces sp. RerS4]